MVFAIDFLRQNSTQGNTDASVVTMVGASGSKCASTGEEAIFSFRETNADVWASVHFQGTSLRRRQHSGSATCAQLGTNLRYSRSWLCQERMALPSCSEVVGDLGWL